MIDVLLGKIGLVYNGLEIERGLSLVCFLGTYHRPLDSLDWIYDSV